MADALIIHLWSLRPAGSAEHILWTLCSLRRLTATGNTSVVIANKNLALVLFAKKADAVFVRSIADRYPRWSHKQFVKAMP